MKIKTLLYSLGLGAGVMYFYDPRNGNRRRAMVRDQFNRIVNQANNAIDTSVNDLRNRTRGTLAEMAGRLDDKQAPDWIIEERVRSRLGRLSRRSSGLEVRSQNGNVILTGPVLRDDVSHLIQTVSRTRGVRSVENQMQVFDNPLDIPALHGIRSGMGQNGNDQNRNWSPATRLLAGVGGGALALYGMARKGIVGPALSLTGLYLAARSVTNQQLGTLLGLRGVEASQNAIRVNKAINIYAPIDQVYRFWSNFENFPLFMNHVKEISVQGGRSHWKVAGPAGSTMEFDAITTRDIPNESIAWQTLPESQVHHDGFVRFDENGDGSTRVSVHMNYVPPAGVVGHAVAKLFGVDPRQAMHDDLVRLKSLLEEGKTSTDETKVRVKQTRGGSAESL